MKKAEAFDIFYPALVIKDPITSMAKILRLVSKSARKRTFHEIKNHISKMVQA